MAICLFVSTCINDVNTYGNTHKKNNRHFGEGGQVSKETVVLRRWEYYNIIGHFRITSGLILEASLGAHLFIYKSIFIHMKMSLICV